MEPHFHFWIDCNRIALFMQLLKWGRKMCYIRSKETKMGSIIGQWLQCYGVDVLRDQWHISSKNWPKWFPLPPSPPTPPPPLPTSLPSFGKGYRSPWRDRRNLPHFCQRFITPVSWIKVWRQSNAKPATFFKYLSVQGTSLNFSRNLCSAILLLDTEQYRVRFQLHNWFYYK